MRFPTLLLLVALIASASILSQGARLRGDSTASIQGPSQQAQDAAASTVPQGASEASSENVLSALEHTPRSLVQHASQVQTAKVQL